jgi:phosphatidylserine/phosphatidylglycerophosphate/cardiolipin synthase-like enzyme
LPSAAARPEHSIEDLRVVRAGPDLEAEALALIGAARESVALSAFLLTAREVKGALQAAAARGAAVRLLLEPSPAGGIGAENALSPASLAEWNASGVWVRAFNTSAPNPARNHAKFAVVDGRSVLVATENFVGAALAAGGANIGYAALLNSSSLARDLLSLFEWDFALGEDRTAGRLAPVHAPPAGAVPLHEPPPPGPTARVLASPEVDASLWVALVEGARFSVAIEALSADNATLGPQSPLGRALTAACARGVVVNVLLSGAFVGDDGGPEALARALAAQAREASCGARLQARIHAPEGGPLLHAKVLVADGARAVLGSHNLVAAAFRENREVSLLIADEAAASALASDLAADFAQGEPVDAAPLALGPAAALGGAPPAEVPGPAPSLFILLAGVGAAACAAASCGRKRTTRRRPRERKRIRRRRSPFPEPLPPPPPALAPTHAVEVPPRDAAPRGFPLRAEPAAALPTPRDLGAPPAPTAFELFERP